MQTRFKWMATDDGGAHLFTDALHLIVGPAEGGWEWFVYNSGHYRQLSQSAPDPKIVNLADAKRSCTAAALNVLRDEVSALGQVEVK